MPALNSAMLPTLPSSVGTPAYDRGEVEPGIVHIGVGGFHRAHQAMYIDQLLGRGLAREWGICGIGLLPQDAAMRDALRDQDFLYTMVIKQPDGRLEPRVIGSIVDYLLAPDDPEAVVERLASETTKIVSLTVTEGGYNLDSVTGAFKSEEPAIVEELASGQPRSVFGYVVEALLRRRERGLAPFTVQSCDNITHNGDVARRTFSAFAELRRPGLGEWIREHVSFPNSMVDRITPVTADEDREALAAETGIEDRWPVVCEPFAQWVIEDSFALGRPPLEEVGVQLVEDVEPYEFMKLRVLNASHQALAYIGLLTGHRYVHEVCADPLFTDYLLAYMDREAVPTLRELPGVDPHEYARTVLSRFSSPQIRDTLARLANGTSNMLPKFALPVLRDQLARGGEIARTTLIVASWARYAEGTDEAGNALDVRDPLAAQLQAAAARHDEDPLAFVKLRDLFGDLAENPVFAAEYTATLNSLRTRGVVETLKELSKR
jgi:mannitol 2-dehydrogenase